MKTNTSSPSNETTSPATAGLGDEATREPAEDPLVATRVRKREDGVEHTRQALRRLVQDSPLTQRAIEERSGFKRGYLSQVLKGHISLSLRHVLGILLATDTAPGPFFAELFPTLGGDPYPGQMGEIRERMARYDSALRELEDKGLLAPADDEPSAGKR